MLEAILVVLIILWFLGYIHISGINIPDFQLFTINGHPVTLWTLLILLVLLALIGILPRPFREIAGAFVFLWILTTLGVIAVAGLSSLLVIAIIIGLIFYIIQTFAGRRI